MFPNDEMSEFEKEVKGLAGSYKVGTEKTGTAIEQSCVGGVTGMVSSGVVRDREIVCGGGDGTRRRSPAEYVHGMLVLGSFRQLEIASDAPLPSLSIANSFERSILIFASRNFNPVQRQPEPYLTLRRKLIEDASGKYFVGQLISAIVQPSQRVSART